MTPDGKHLVTGSGDKTARMWSLEDGQMVKEFMGTTMGEFGGGRRKHLEMDERQDGAHVVVGRRTDGERRGARRRCEAVRDADGKHLVTGSRDKTARMWSLEDGQMVKEFKGHDSL